MADLSRNNIGVPQNSREAFELLATIGVIDDYLARKMKAMVGFRNIAIHDYQKLNPEVVRKMIESHLQDFRDYSDAIMSHIKLGTRG